MSPSKVARRQSGLYVPRVSALSAYALAVLADAPLAYYRLGETSGTVAADSSGNAHSGTYTNNPTLGAAGLVTGDSNTAMGTAAGTGQRVVVPSNSTGWMNAPLALTVEAIVRYPGTPGQAIVSRWGSSINAWILYRDTGTARIFGAIYTGSAGGRAFFVDSLLTPVAGVKYHLAFTYDNAILRFYVNGSPTGTATASGFVNFNGTGGAIDLEIGRDSLADANTPTATIDEVAFYGTTLSAARIAAHYAVA